MNTNPDMEVHSMRKQISANYLPLIYLEANGVKEQMELASITIQTNIGQVTSSDNGSVFAFLGCFTCELYLKFIIACEKWDKQKPTVDLQYGHKLVTLFNLLSSECRQTLRSILKESKVVNSEQEFDECLSACSEGFVKWRYYFEIENPVDELNTEDYTIEIRSGFLVELSNALSDYCKKIFDKINYPFDSDKVHFIELI